MLRCIFLGMVGYALTTVSLVACSDRGSDGSERALAWPTGEWSIESPESQGMDSALLERPRQYAFQEDRNTQGVVIARGGVLVAEWYADGANAGSWAASWSVAKSFTSALIGIAIDEGLIESVDVPVSNFIPSWAGTEKEKIRLRDILQITSGLAWSENYDPAAAASSDVTQLVIQGGRELQYVTEKTLAEPPGAVFNYSSGNTMLLSAVLQTATGMSAADYARRKLFSPLGVEQVDWWQSTDGHTLTFCCIDMASRDFARFGLLYARGGRWAGEQLIPSKWIAESVAPSPANDGYGYQWWLLGRQIQEGPGTPPMPSTLPSDAFAAIGVDDQVIYVVPHLDLLVVRNGRYVKDAGEPIADPTLLAHYAPFGLSESHGTFSANSWNHREFLQLVLDAIH